MLNDLVFFTLNDFQKDDGGTVRMYGILNALAKTGRNVILISNADNINNFHPKIRHVKLEKPISKLEKQYLQFLLGILPFFLVRILTFFTVQNIRNKILYYNLVGREIVFFEYMDNSLGYILKRLHVIDDYINDIHGVASIEFKYKANQNIKSKLVNYIKYKVAENLDKKVFKEAKGYIFVSGSMKDYFSSIYPFLKDKKTFIVRDGIGKLMCEQSVDKALLKELKQDINITDNTKVVLFAGDFKDLGGVVDLVEAFSNLVKKQLFSDIKLILIGDGEKFNHIKEVVEVNKLSTEIVLLGRVSYNKLRTYQELAHVIVCPDKKHPYSNMVPHIKYFDSLVSNKVVINGSFDSVKEFNRNEILSLSFEPSNILDLENKIKDAIMNNDVYREKYQNNREIVCAQFTYDRYIDNVIK